jgi:hypothetical protein
MGLQILERLGAGASQRDVVAVIFEDDAEPFASRVVALHDQNFVLS